MGRRVESDNHNRWFVDGNNFSASFSDWVVKIVFHIFYKDDPLESSMMHAANQIANPKWIVRFGQGEGGKWAHPIYCDTLENAFELVDNYEEQIKFDDLMKKLYEDHNQPSDSLYSNNGI